MSGSEILLAQNIWTKPSDRRASKLLTLCVFFLMTFGTLGLVAESHASHTRGSAIGRVFRSDWPLNRTPTHSPRSSGDGIQLCQTNSDWGFAATLKISEWQIAALWQVQELLHWWVKGAAQLRRGFMQKRSVEKKNSNYILPSAVIKCKLTK